MEQFRTTVIITTYNRSKLLSRALNSVKSLTIPANEVIVVDDCSTDNTSEVIKPHIGERLKYIRLPRNSGVAIATNEGIRNSSSEYICFLNDDDELCYNYLAEMEVAIKCASSNVAFLWGARQYICDLPGGLVNSLSMGIPSLGTKWSHKYLELFRDYDFPEGCIDLPAKGESIQKVIESIMDQGNYENIRLKLLSRSKIMREKTFEMWRTVFDRIEKHILENGK